MTEAEVTWVPRSPTTEGRTAAITRGRLVRRILRGLGCGVLAGLALSAVVLVGPPLPDGTPGAPEPVAAWGCGNNTGPNMVGFLSDANGNAATGWYKNYPGLNWYGRYTNIVSTNWITCSNTLEYDGVVVRVFGQTYWWWGLLSNLNLSSCHWVTGTPDWIHANNGPCPSPTTNRYPMPMYGENWYQTGAVGVPNDGDMEFVHTICGTNYTGALYGMAVAKPGTNCIAATADVFGTSQGWGWDVTWPQINSGSASNAGAGSNRVVPITFNVSDPMSGVSQTWPMYWNGAAFVSCGSSAGGTTGTVYCTLPSDGSFTVGLATQDVAGNYSGTNWAQGVGVDITAPSTPSITSPTSTLYTGATSGTVTWSAASDNFSGLAGYYVNYHWATLSNGSCINAGANSGWQWVGATTSWVPVWGSNTCFQFQVVAKDNYGNWGSGSAWSAWIESDQAPPTGSISIAGGAAYATSTAVTLSLTYADPGSGPYQMQVQNAGGAWSGWQAVAPTKAWTLSTGDGTKTVNYQVKDHAGQISTTYSDTIVLDTVNPTATISIAGGAAWTTSTGVTLNVSSSDATSGVATTQASNDNSTYTSVSGSTPSWTLTSANGTKTVWFKVTDAAGRWTTASDTIGLDTVDPSATIAINNGASTTASTTVTLNVTADDGTSGVATTAASNDNVTFTPVSGSAPAWTLTAGDGSKTVWYRVTDVAGLSMTVSDTITLATGPAADFDSPDEGSTALNAGALITVEWIESGDIATRSLQRQYGLITTPGDCAPVSWSDDGAAVTTSSPVTAAGLLDQHCYRWVLTLTDSASQVSTSTSGSILVDLTNPLAEVTAPAVDLIQQTGAVQISWIESDAASGVGGRYVQRERMPLPTDGTCTGFAWTTDGSVMTTPSPLNVATLTAGHCYRWRLTVVDGVGNMATALTPTLLVDPFPATADFATPNEGSVQPLGSSGLRITWAEDARFGVPVVSRSLQSQNTPATGTTCGGTWTNNGSPSTSESPVRVEALVPETCYRWLLTLTDQLGNSSVTTSGTVRVEPSVLNDPIAGATLFGDETLSASSLVADVASIEFLVDGASVAIDSTAPYEAILDTSQVTNGAHQLQIRVTAGSGTTTSTAVATTVANDLGSIARIEADNAEGELTIDDYVRYGIYALYSENALPIRYQFETVEAEAELPLQQYLQYWDSLAASTQSALTDELSVPLSGDLLHPTQNMGGPEPDFGNCDNTLNADPFVVKYCYHDTEQGHFTLRYVIGESTTDSTVERVDQNSNGVPDRVDQIGDALEAAWTTYVVDLGYEDPAPGGRTNVVLSRSGDRSGRVMVFFPLPLPTLMALDPASPDEYLVKHLVPHEMFHVIQYHYALPLDSERGFWYEATANFGALQLLRETIQVDPDNTWTGNVGAYLGTSELELSEGSPWGEEREYAMSLVGEYLRMVGGEFAVRRTWELIRAGRTAKEAIRDTVNELADPAPPFPVAWLDYAARAYEMDFPDIDQEMMRDKLADYMTAPKESHPVPDPANTNVDDVGSPRPARHRANLAPGISQDGELRVNELGMGYVDLVPTAPQPYSGSITVQAELPDGVVARLVAYRSQAGPQPEDIDGPIPCGDSDDLAMENGAWTAEVAVSDTCPFATLIIARIAPPALFAGPTKWTATFNDNIVSNGTVALGVNPTGNLIVANAIPSAGQQERQVGLRLLTNPAGPLDGISPGCDCEGWGIAASNLLGATAYAQFGSDIVANMSVTEFSKTGQGATSRVLAAGIFDVTHQFDPVPGQPHLYRITVTVTNVGIQDANVRYRRVMDWDAEPTAFLEYTTIGHFGSPPLSLVYSSNDGFQIADPMEPPTNASATGFYDDDGADDWGAMFDFDFGALAPSATLSFELFYGAAPSEAIALAELQAVGAQVYSLGQPSSPGGKEFGQPVTFMFGMREVVGGSFAPLREAAGTEASTVGSELPGAPPRNRNDE